MATPKRKSFHGDNETESMPRTTRKVMEVTIPSFTPCISTRSQAKRSHIDQEEVAEDASTATWSNATRSKRHRPSLAIAPPSQPAVEVAEDASTATTESKAIKPKRRYPNLTVAPPSQPVVKVKQDEEDVVEDASLFGSAQSSPVLTAEPLNEERRQIAGLYGHIKGLRFVCAGGPPPQDDSIDVNFEDQPELQAVFLKEQVKALEFGFRLHKRLA